MNINFDDIEIMHPDAGGGNVYYYQGQPFTGTIVEYNNLNVLVGEITVVNGHTRGRVASYYNTGQIKEEYFEKYNQMYSIYKKWNQNGGLEFQQDYGPEP
jgi:antitoxin component YwqK of YwqJK toxin-antitoxin module